MRSWLINHKLRRAEALRRSGWSDRDHTYHKGGLRPRNAPEPPRGVSQPPEPPRSSGGLHRPLERVWWEYDGSQKPHYIVHPPES